MMYHLVSTDPNNYGTVKFRSSINTMNSLVMYRVNSVSTTMNILTTTTDDYLIIETILENECIELTLHFQNRVAYDMRTLAYELNNLFEGQLVSDNESLPIQFLISMDLTNKLIINANKEFVIKDASHRAKMLLGLYHTHLPIASTNKRLFCVSSPLLWYGNVLYLTARTDFVSVVNTDNKEITRSIAYKVNELLYPGVPINCRLPGSWSVISSDQLSSLEFTLVDFQLEPVILQSPLFLSLEIQSINDSSFLPNVNDRGIDWMLD